MQSALLESCRIQSAGFQETINNAYFNNSKVVRMITETLVTLIWYSQLIMKDEGIQISTPIQSMLRKTAWNKTMPLGCICGLLKTKIVHRIMPHWSNQTG